MSGSEDSATRGAPFIETYRRELADGKVHVEILLPDGRRRALVLWPHEATADNLEGIADAYMANRARVAGRDIRAKL